MADSRNGGSTAFYVLGDAVHILFVDGDPIMREFATVHLATDKAEVATAGDGPEALAAVAAHPPDILLLDLEMPNLDGFATLGRLRAEPATRDLPVIVMTGCEDADAIDRAFDAGATAFLVKPIDWRLLSCQIRYVRRAGRGEPQPEVQPSAPQPPGADVSNEALLELAREGAALIRLAMKAGPELRHAGLSYAALLADTVGPQPQKQGFG